MRGKRGPRERRDKGKSFVKMVKKFSPTDPQRGKNDRNHTSPEREGGRKMSHIHPSGSQATTLLTLPDIKKKQTHEGTYEPTTERRG